MALTTICSTNMKGGVGKTTASVSLAHGLALQKNKKVLLLDLGPQGHCAVSLGLDPEPGVFDFLVNEVPVANVIRETGRPLLNLLPGNSRTTRAASICQLEHIGVDQVGDRLLNELIGYDFLVIDTHPGGYFQELGLYMADLLIIPSALDYLALDGVSTVLELLEQLIQRYQCRPGRKFILPMFADHTKETTANLVSLQETFPELVVEPIPRRTKAREAVSYGQTIWEYAPQDDTALAYLGLLDRMTKIEDEQHDQT
ncbi:ParA family protein [Chloroflexi bacterium TSY]|nr:ParA family protein [Chloroflexi bacterium TSY]